MLLAVNNMKRYYVGRRLKKCDKLEITYKEAEKVMKIIISLLVYEYELLHIKDGESIEYIFASFEKIIIEFKSLRKNNHVSNHIVKIFRILHP